MTRTRNILAAALTLVAVTLPADAGAQSPARIDRDGDGMLESLERRLARLGRADAITVIVSLRDPPTPERVRALEREVGGFDLADRFSVANAFAATMRADQVRDLAGRPAVALVEENAEVRALNASAQEAFGATHARLEAPGLDGNADGNAVTYSKDDLVAAVIDTGIDPGHEDLDGGKVIAFKDFVGDRTTAYDDDGHGTHVSATLAGAGDGPESSASAGVAPGAGLVGVKVLDRRGSGSTADVLAGIDWVVQNRSLFGIEALNLSLGVDGCSDGTDALSEAANDARDAGLVVVASAGNEGPATCTVGTPGAAADAVTVGAMADTAAATQRADGGFYQAVFSSRGDPSAPVEKPDVSAPGVSIRSASAGTRSRYENLSGTSMATPFVTGLALLMLDANPGLSPQQVKTHVTGTAQDWGPTGHDIDYGAGRLDAYAALDQAGAALPPPPPEPVHMSAEGTLNGGNTFDEFTLNVQDLSVPVAATLIHTDVDEESLLDEDGDLAFGHAFDLVLLDPDGDEVARSDFRTRQEELGRMPAETGTYKVRVERVPGSTSAGSYALDVSAGGPTDVLRPHTRITSAPAQQTSSANATFAFRAEPNATYECRLDGASFAPCQSPASFSGLAEGTHTFRVRARDAAGNDELVEEARRWTVDATPPDTAIDSGPESPTIETSATFTFSSADGASARFQCSLDGETFGSCSGPYTRAGLALGSHTLAVRAIDEAGNVDPTPAQRTWTIVAPASTHVDPVEPALDPPSPVARLVSLVTPAEETLAALTSRRGLPLSIGCLGACAADARLNVSRATARELGIATAANVPVGVGSGARETAGRLPLAVRLARGARTALRRARSVAFTLHVRVRDAAGGQRTFTARIAAGRAVSRRRTASRGVPLAVGCSGPCAVTGELVLSRRAAQSLGLDAAGRTVVVGRGERTLGGAGQGRTVVTLSGRAAAALRSRRRRVTFTLRTRVADSTGVTTATRRLRIG